MSVAGDRLETYAYMEDGAGDPLTGLTLTILDARDPNGDEIAPAALTWDEIEPGNYAVYFDTDTSSPLGQYTISFQFNDTDESIWTENNWVLATSPLVIYPATAPAFQTGTPLNVAPHYRDIDDTHDSQYYKRGELTPPEPHIHIDAGEVATFSDTASINFTLAGSVITADAVFGTTAGTVAEGDALALKLEADDLADVAITGDFADLSGVPATFPSSPHSHAGADITTGTIAIARIPTGTTGSTVALGNHQHTISDTWNIPLGYTGGGVIPTGVYIDVVIPYTMTLSGFWTLVAMTTPGAIVLDLWKSPYSSFPPVVANTIIGGGGAKPTIVATSNKGQGVFDGWTATTLTGGDILRINVDSRTAIEQVTLGLGHTRTI